MKNPAMGRRGYAGLPAAAILKVRRAGWWLCGPRTDDREICVIMRLVLRWLGRVVVALAVMFVAVYGGDSLVFKLRGSPSGKVTVNRYVSIPLKGQRTEFDYQGTVDVPCAQSIFPQAGQNPCWQLLRNPNLGMAL
jgi:hypothetical protein